LAKAAGVSQAFISRVEAGERSLPVDSVRALVAKYPTDLADLLGAARPNEVLHALSSAWAAYDGARQSFLSVLEDVRDVCRSLGKARVRWHTLPIPADLAKTLTRWSQLEFLERADRRAPPSKEARHDYRRFASQLTPPLEAFLRTNALIRATDGLEDEDIRYLTSLARRLRSGEWAQTPADEDDRYQLRLWEE